VVVRHAAVAPGATASAPASAEMAAAAPARPVAARPSGQAERVIARNDMVEVLYEAGGVRLTITGRAEGNAAQGQRLAIRNLQSNRIIDAVATGPGQAVAGPAARASAPSQQFAAR
jgi:flagella basal body P-ring formation protein FlgA